MSVNYVDGCLNYENIFNGFGLYHTKSKSVNDFNNASKHHIFVGMEKTVLVDTRG